MEQLKGLGVALVTPFQENGNVDYNGLQKLVEHNINGGTDYLVVQGTTGESVTLTAEEKRAVLDFILEINNKRLPIVFGIGGNNTRALLDTFESFDLTGVDAILSASPAYNKPTQEGIYQHYKALNDAAPRPIILYNVPGRTASNVTAETTVRISHELKNIVAVKEASGNIGQMMQIIKDRAPGFLMLSGDDPIAMPLIATGAEGLISVIGNAFPAEYSQMIHAAMDGNFEEARRLHYELYDIIHYLFVDGNPAGIKETLRILGICGNKVRLPLVGVSAGTKAKLEELIGQLEPVK